MSHNGATGQMGRRQMEEHPKDHSHAVDSFVGRRIRMRRKTLGMSQETLANAIGITFQQVQKYENAANRVSASKLYEIAKALQVAPGYFFEGLGEPADQDLATQGLSAAFLASDDLAELARSFPKIRTAERRKIIDLVRALATADHDLS